VHVRRRGSLESPEEVLLDLDELARGRDFYDVAELAVSPDNRLLAYAEDTVGRRQYTLRFKDLATGQSLPDAIPNVEAAVAWAADNRTVLYIEKDPETLLGNRVRKHVLGTDPAADPLVYEETDDSYYTDVGQSKDNGISTSFRTARSRASSATPTRWTRHSNSGPPAAGAGPRVPGRPLRRTLDHPHQLAREPAWSGAARPVGGSQPVAGPHRPPRRCVHSRLRRIPGFPGRRGRSAGFAGAHPAVGRETILTSPQTGRVPRRARRQQSSTAPSSATPALRSDPGATYDYDVRTGLRTLLKREPVLGDFAAERYVTEYRWAPARDGEQVPVALVYRKGYRKDGSAPLLQYAYGSYGLSSDPAFSSAVLSLLDRGFVYAIAQVRGGQELGRRWYDSGRLLNKRNTFTDFIDATRFLLEEGYADPERVFAGGGSAGGLLVAPLRISRRSTTRPSSPTCLSWTS
jgi:oligopeptidase B